MNKIKALAASTLAVLGLALAVAPADAAPAPAGGPPLADAMVTLETRQVKPDLYVVLGAGGNTIVRKTRDGAIVIDTKYQGRNVYEALKRELAAIKAGPVKYVLLTHYHADHSGNSGAFQADGAQLMGQNAVPALLPRLSPKATDVPAPSAPTLTFDKRQTLRLGGAVIEAYNFGPGHTLGDGVYYLPDLKVVMTGDLAISQITPNIDYPGGGSMMGLQHVLHEIAKLDFDLCLPGHRDQMMSRADYMDFMRRWDLFVDRARSLVRAGAPKAEFFTRLKSDDLGFDFTTFGWPTRVDAIYQEFSTP